MIDGLGRVGVLGMTAPKELGVVDFRKWRIAESWRKSAAAARRPPFSSMRITRSEFARCCSLGRTSKSDDGCRNWSSGEQLAAFALTEEEADRMRPTCRCSATERRWLALHSQR